VSDSVELTKTTLQIKKVDSS